MFSTKDKMLSKGMHVMDRTQPQNLNLKEPSNMPLKLLFLAYFFPPANASGCVRTWNIAKHLRRLGWDVIVITPQPSVWRYLNDPEKTEKQLAVEGIRRILTSHRWRCLAPHSLNYRNGNLAGLIGGICRKAVGHFGIDSRIGWIKPARRACKTLSAKDVDAILVSGHPFAAFELAKQLADQLERPYILDYRDPWTGNPHRNARRPGAAAKEAALLAGCAAVTIVSHSWGVAMEQRFGLGSKLCVITNGYDPEELRDIKPYDFGHFAIVYTGTFYPPKRTISPVMAALRRIKETMNSMRADWAFHYYGDKEDHVHQEAQRFGVLDRVVLHGRVPRAEALSAVRGAGVAVVITSVAGEGTLEDNGIVTGKVFDALGLCVPILLIAPPGSDTENIAETTGLARSFSGDDVDGIVSLLKDLMDGRALKATNLEQYAWTSIAQRFDTVLRRAVVRTNHSSHKP